QENRHQGEAHRHRRAWRHHRRAGTVLLGRGIMKTVKGARIPAAVASRPATEHMHLTDYLRMLYKWRWVAFPVFLIAFVAGAVNTLRQTPIFEGHVQLLIAQDTPSIGKIDQMFQTGDSYYNDDFYQTQYRILQSRSLAKQTIEAMHLWNAPR